MTILYNSTAQYFLYSVLLEGSPVFTAVPCWHDKRNADCLLCSHLLFIAYSCNIFGYQRQHTYCVNNLRYLTHWGRVMHICVSKLTFIGSDNGLAPAIIWTNAGLLLIGPLGTNFGEIFIEVLTFSFKKMRLKVSSAKRRPFCLGLNELNLIHSSGF